MVIEDFKKLGDAAAGAATEVCVRRDVIDASDQT
jgi:hypothetical protein